MPSGWRLTAGERASGSFPTTLELVRSGRISPPPKGSARHFGMKMDLSEEISQTPLEEPGWVLKVDLTGPTTCIRRLRENISRTIRVPKTITFHQLNGILTRALGWNSRYRERMIWGGDKDYRFVLWDEVPRIGLFADPPREILVADHKGQDDNWKSSKNRKLAQVFGGSRIWPEAPASIQYEVQFGGTDLEWRYEIECLGETDCCYQLRPGQEAFCIEGTGYPLEFDLEDSIPVEELDAWRDHFDLEFTNNNMEGWCTTWRMKQHKSGL